MKLDIKNSVAHLQQMVRGLSKELDQRVMTPVASPTQCTGASINVLVNLESQVKYRLHSSMADFTFTSLQLIQEHTRNLRQHLRDLQALVIDADEVSPDDTRDTFGFRIWEAQQRLYCDCMALQHLLEGCEMGYAADVTIPPDGLLHAYKGSAGPIYLLTSGSHQVLFTPLAAVRERVQQILPDILWMRTSLLEGSHVDA